MHFFYHFTCCWLGQTESHFANSEIPNNPNEPFGFRLPLWQKGTFKKKKIDAHKIQLPLQYLRETIPSRGLVSIKKFGR